MPDPGYDLRPDVETFECMGCPVALVDGADILAVAGAQRVDLLHGAAFPAPVRQVRFSVAGGVQDGRPVHELVAKIYTGDLASDWLGSVVLGNDPIGALLARRLAAGDQWAARIVDGVGTAAAEVYRRLGLGRPARTDHTGGGAPAGSAVRERDTAGLRATITYAGVPAASSRSPGSGRIIAVRATVPSEEISPVHLRAMFCLVLEVVAELVGATRGAGALAGRSYVLSRYPVARSSDPDTSDSVNLDQVGGLAGVVAQFRQIAVSFQHPQVMARWGARRPQGILMYGPPGTGKTMLARALANEIGANFREIRTPEILDKWLGASERNIKRIFREAKRYRQPTVLLFDEFDSIISYVGGGSDAASQAVNAVAGIFKQEMNNLIEENPNVIVVATTNFPHRVDDSLIRSGRFDIKMAIPVPDVEGRVEIIVKMIRQLIARHEVSGFRMFADDLDPRELATASHGMTGADIKELLRRAQLAKAMQEARTGTAAPPISQEELKQCIADLRHTGSAS